MHACCIPQCRPAACLLRACCAHRFDTGRARHLPPAHPLIAQLKTADSGD